MGWLVGLIDPEAHACADENDQQNADSPGEQFVAAGTALGKVAHLALGLAALVLGGIPGLGLTGNRRGGQRFCRRAGSRYLFGDRLLLFGSRTYARAGFDRGSVRGRDLPAGSVSSILTGPGRFSGGLTISGFAHDSDSPYFTSGLAVLFFLKKPSFILPERKPWRSTVT